MKRNKAKRALALGLALVTAGATLLNGCGSNGGSTASTEGDDTSREYTFLIEAAEASVYYDEYNENPVYKYWASQEWDADGDGTGYPISIDFLQPPSGSESDYTNTLISTGDYPDVMVTSYSSDKASQLYEEGIAIDLTDYVEQYMPNYMKWIEEHPEYAYMMYANVDGEKKIIELYQVADEEPARWCGWCYRRDWLVKYGTNPETGEAFTGGWNEDRTEWTDDVVFPSGNTNPVYISDWEWMLDIIQKAIDDQGISDGYAMQLYYMGFNPLGDLVSGFGGSGGSWYLNSDGECSFGPTEDGFRAYLECMREWYKKGWIDQDFEENAADTLFWKVDVATVFSGKVGVWYGQTGSLGNSIQTDESDTLTAGICVYGAPSPINDEYGDASVQGCEPLTTYGESMLGSSYILTNKMLDDEKDIATFLTALDALYDGDSWSRKVWIGFSDEEQAEIQDEFYNEWGLEDGAYSEEEIDGETYYVRNPAILEHDNLDTAAKLKRIGGLTARHNVDEGYNQAQRQAVNAWATYSSSGSIPSALTSQLTSEQSSDYATISGSISTYGAVEAPGFITGVKDINDDAQWQEFVDGYNELRVQDYCDWINAVLGK